MSVKFEDIMKKIIMNSEDIFQLIDECIMDNNFELNPIDNSFKITIVNLGSAEAYHYYNTHIKYKHMNYVIITQETINEAIEDMKNNGWKDVHISVSTSDHQCHPSICNDNAYFMDNLCFYIFLFPNSKDTDIVKAYNGSLFRTFNVNLRA